MQAPALDPTHPAHDEPERPRVALLLAAAMSLTGAGDYLLYGHRLGLGVALFFALLWGALAAYRRPGRFGAKEHLLTVLMAATAAASVIAPSAANILLLLALTLYASGHWLADRLSPYWARFLQGLAALLWFPSALANLGRGLDQMWGAAGASGVRRGAGWLVRGLRIVLPVALLLVPFVVLLGQGNAVLGHAFSEALFDLFGWLANVEAPDESRVAFWIVIAAAAFSLLGNRAPRPFAAGRLPAPADRPAPRDMAVAVWRMRLLLIGVNVLFFAANATDLLFLWGGAQLPVGVSFSKFVHEGTYNLIACTLLAGAVLSSLFRGSSAVAGARGQRGLASLWIVQNLALAAGVVLRVTLYIDAYGMSVLRVHLLLFLALVGCGFALLAAYIIGRRPMRWLVGANLLAVFALFFVGQFLDVRGFVAGYNVRAVIAEPARAADLDIAYLHRLAPESWPALAELSARPELLGGGAAALGRKLERSARAEAALAAAEDWRAWNWRRHRLRRALPGFDALLEGAAGGESRLAGR